MSAAAELCEYEKQRLANIKRNEAALAALGIGQAKKEMATADRARSQQAVRRRKQPAWGAADPSRVSSRLKGKPGPTYAETDEAERQSSSAWVGRRQNSGRRDFFATGFNNTVWPTQEQVAQAAAAAEATVTNSQVAASVKVMLPSHVSGGYWLQMPVDLAEHLPGSMGKHRFRLIDAEGHEPAADSGPGFPVIWLRRGGSGGGLSGGWRGFAIDRELGVGDVVAFEKLSGNQLRATVHRAMSLDDRLALALSHTGGGGANPLGEPKKALSAFMIFTAEKRPLVRVEDPERYSDLGTCQKRIAELWREATDEEKQPFHEKAKLDRQRYLKERLEQTEAEADLDDEEEQEEQEAVEGAMAAAAQAAKAAKTTEFSSPPARKRPASQRASKPSRAAASAAAAAGGRAAKRSKKAPAAQQTEEDLFEVESVLDSKGDTYQVRWKGYDASHDSWEPKPEIKAGAPDAVARWEAVLAATKRGGIKRNSRVEVKFGQKFYAGGVLRVHKPRTATTKGKKAGSGGGKQQQQQQQPPEFDVLFDSDGETWRIQPGLHIYRLL